MNNAKKQRKTIEWERLDISSRKLEIPREYVTEIWAQYCSHEIKRPLLLGRKAMTNLDRILKSKGEKERYTHLNAEFQRIARRIRKSSSVINRKK